MSSILFQLIHHKYTSIHLYPTRDIFSLTTSAIIRQYHNNIQGQTEEEVPPLHYYSYLIQLYLYQGIIKY